jgi:hypothetical protein
MMREANRMFPLMRAQWSGLFMTMREVAFPHD